MAHSPAPRALRRPLRVGVAGLGAVAQAVHLPLLERLRDTFQIAAICDLSASLLTAIGERYRVPAEHRFRDVPAMLDSVALDALIALTSGSHGDVAAAALEHGLPVLSEKPLALTRAEADRLTALEGADHDGERLMVGYMKLFDPAVEEAVRIAHDPARPIGALRAVEVTVLHPSSESQLAHARLLPPPDDIDPATLARLRERSSELEVHALGPAAATLGRLYGGILLGSIVHELAVVRAVAGDPAAMERVDTWPDGAWPPSVAVQGRLADGARLSIDWLFLPEYPAYREDVRFHYERGSVELSFPAPYRLHMPTELVVSTGGGETRQRVQLDSIEEAFERELLAFAAMVADGERARSGIADGRADIVTCQRMVARLAHDLGLEIGGEAAGS
ncbi:MAG TPA: Gfo/Idh/MocA family oxidoreductase [Methylomirabilota bacterium]|nr:Gfo/Idh/MocA family oxidoreductase [Methylomirabilota bacterium]